MVFFSPETALISDGQRAEMHGSATVLADAGN